MLLQNEHAVTQTQNLTFTVQFLVTPNTLTTLSLLVHTMHIEVGQGHRDDRTSLLLLRTIDSGNCRLTIPSAKLSRFRSYFALLTIYRLSERLGEGGQYECSFSLLTDEWSVSVSQDYCAWCGHRSIQ